MTNAIPAWAQAKRDAQRALSQSLMVSPFAGVVTYRNPDVAQSAPCAIVAYVETLTAHDAPDQCNAPSQCNDDAPDMGDEGVGFSYIIEQ